MKETLQDGVFAASNLVWGPWTLALLFGTGWFLTFRYRGIQLTGLLRALRALRSRSSNETGALTPFQAFATGLAASVGTGNIAGVATAIATGGPGALFWIWAYGFVATTIKLTEAMLAVRYRRPERDFLSAGPMHYLELGLKQPWLGRIYAWLAGTAALATTPFTQPNSIAVSFQHQLGVKPLWVGLALAFLTAAVVFGGVTLVGRAAERLAPTMVLLYLAGGVWVILSHLHHLPRVLTEIFSSAFSLQAAEGGVFGTGLMLAMRYGVARGIYANEAGYGTAAVAYGSARSNQPVVQGFAAMVEVYIVSFVTASVSGLSILLAGVLSSGAQSTALVGAAFDSAMPAGGYLVLACALLFGYTTLIGWGYYGEQFLRYLFGARIVLPYRWVYCSLIVLGATLKVELVWAWGDLLNGLQIYPNLLGVLFLSGWVARELKE
jgi:AGCS family alanine or glycine:cation symporter